MVSASAAEAAWPALLQALRDLDALPAGLNAGHSERFFADFPLDHIFRAFSSASSPTDVEFASAVLSLLFATYTGRALLPTATHALEAARSAPLPCLRRLAAEQYGQLLLMTTEQQQHPALDVAELAGKLCDMLLDKDTGVAEAAAAALSRYGRSSDPALRALLLPGSAAAARLAAVAASADSTVRLRALALMLGLAAGVHGCNSSSTTTAAAVNGHADGQATANGHATNLASGYSRLQLIRESGLLQPLQEQLSSTRDPLACLASLQALDNVIISSSSSVEDSASVAHGLAGLLLPQLVAMVSDEMLRDAALPLIASIVRTCLRDGVVPSLGMSRLQVEDDTGAMDVDAPPAGAAPGSIAPALLGAMVAVLDDRGDAGPESEAGVLDAAGVLGESRAGAAMVLAAPGLAESILERCLGRVPHPDVRTTALHAAASIAGLERAGEDQSRSAAILPAQAEDTLRRAVFAACGGKRPGEVVAGLLHQPFLEARLAVFRFIAAMSLRCWFAAEVVTSPDLVNRLLQPASESGQAACNWRYACVLALLSAARAATAPGDSGGSSGGSGTQVADAAFRGMLAPALGALQESAKAGPYGSGAADVAGRHEHIVATQGG